MSDLLPIGFEFTGEREVTLHWDETDPRAIALGINDWTEAEWLEALTETLEREQEDQGCPSDD